jgi:dolichol-phosphate mannosyltransferase
MNRLRLSVVIPSHNEEANLPGTLAELQRALDGEGVPYEIILVDDNSEDGTAAVIRGSCQRDGRIQGVYRNPPSGFGRAVRAGLDAVRGDIVIVYMADRSDHPKDAIAYYRKLEEGYDCVFGSRFVRGASVQNYPRVKLLVNRVVNKLIQWVFWCPFNDLTNAFKGYRTQVIREGGPYRSSHFNITIEMSLSALIRRYHIAQIPIDWSGRTAGVSKLRMIEMGRRYLSTLVKTMAERFLIEDDVIADRLAWQAGREDRLAYLEERVRLIDNQEDRFPIADTPEARDHRELVAKVDL